MLILTNFSEDMAKLKPSLPYGQLPLLEYKGTTITQSVAIARFLAHEFGLGGKTPLIDANIDEVRDIWTQAEGKDQLVVRVSAIPNGARYRLQGERGFVQAMGKTIGAGFEQGFNQGLRQSRISR